MMSQIAEIVAKNLLQIKAIKLEPANYFTWASGWRSPIYCDNRKTLSYPSVRALIRDSFVEMICGQFADFEVVAGVATGAIAHGVLVAEALEKPFVYVRPAAKDHGLTNQIEGELHSGSRVLVVEDLISTGGSSLKAIEALREAQCEVVGMVAIFSYGFQQAADGFGKARVKVATLSNYDTLLHEACKTGYISEHDLSVLKEWRKSPADWKR